MLFEAQLWPAYIMPKLHSLRGRSHKLYIKEGKKSSQPFRQPEEAMQDRFIMGSVHLLPLLLTWSLHCRVLSESHLLTLAGPCYMWKPGCPPPFPLPSISAQQIHWQLLGRSGPRERWLCFGIWGMQWSEGKLLQKLCQEASVEQLVLWMFSFPWALGNSHISRALLSPAKGRIHSAVSWQILPS